MLLEQTLVRILQLFAPRDDHLFQGKIADLDQVQNPRAGDSRTPYVQVFKSFWRGHKGENAVVTYIDAA